MVLWYYQGSRTLQANIVAMITDTKKIIVQAQTVLRDYAEQFWFDYARTGNKSKQAQYHSIHDIIRNLDTV